MLANSDPPGFRADPRPKALLIGTHHGIQPIGPNRIEELFYSRIIRPKRLMRDQHPQSRRSPIDSQTPRRISLRTGPPAPERLAPPSGPRLPNSGIASRS